MSELILGAMFICELIQWRQMRKLKRERDYLLKVIAKAHDVIARAVGADR